MKNFKPYLQFVVLCLLLFVFLGCHTLVGVSEDAKGNKTTGIYTSLGETSAAGLKGSAISIPGASIFKAVVDTGVGVVMSFLGRAPTVVKVVQEVASVPALIEPSGLDTPDLRYLIQPHEHIENAPNVVWDWAEGAGALDMGDPTRESTVD